MPKKEQKELQDELFLFKESEFDRDGQKPEDLYHAIKNAHIGLRYDRASNPIKALNELLEDNGLFERLNPKDGEKLITEFLSNSEFLNNLKKKHDKTQKLKDLRCLNRYLLESYFPFETPLRRRLNRIYKRRYEEAFHWIKYHLLFKNTGLLYALAWYLPMIFLEGKIVWAFYKSVTARSPVFDTVTIPGGNEIFKFNAFKKSLTKVENNLDNLQRVVKLDEYSFLDYFGIPCPDPKKHKKQTYFCKYYEIKLFDGKFVFWLAAKEEDINNFGGKSWDYHEEKLTFYLQKIADVYEEIIEKNNNIDKILYGHKFDVNDHRPSTERIKLSEYLVEALNNLHDSLLATFDNEEPYRIFFLLDEYLFSARNRFFFTRNQTISFKKLYAEFDEKKEKGEVPQSILDEKMKYDHQIELAKKADPTKTMGKDNMEIGLDILSGTGQTGVSSIATQKGIPEFYFEQELFTCHPLLFKKELVEEKYGKGYSYPPELSNIEPMILVHLPSLRSDADQAITEFVLIPFFFRDHPLGCIAFFNPNAKGSDSWFDYLSKVYMLLDEKEDFIYQAAIKDLCQQIAEIYQKTTGSHKEALDHINKYFVESLFSGHFFIGFSRADLKQRLHQYYPTGTGLPGELLCDGTDEINILSGKSIRGYEIKHEKRMPGSVFFCSVNSLDHNSAWEKQTDSDVKKTIETASYAYNLRMDVLRHATRAAVAAIMGRNMSHNIGSHVLSYWKQKLGDFEKEIKSLIKTELEKLSNTCDDLKPKSEGGEAVEQDEHINAIGEDNVITFVKALELLRIEDIFYQLRFEIDKASQCLMKSHLLTDIDQSVHLFDYLKTRMEFIAEITTMSPSWCRTMDFVNDILQPFKKHQRALLENIVLSEDFVEGENFTFNIINGAPSAQREQKCFVSIPHGEVGTHALFSIFENFIRNSAKHGGERIRQTSKQFEIAVTYKDEDDHVAVTLTDNVGNCNAKTESGKSVIELLSEAIDKNEYVDPKDGTLIKGGWGIKEIKLSANFLRMRSTDSILDSVNDIPENKKRPLVRLDCYDSHCKKAKQCHKNDSANLSLTFFLNKPKEVAIVYGNNKDINKIISNSGLRESLHRAGIDFYETGAALSYLENSNIMHSFLVYDSVETYNELKVAIAKSVIFTPENIITPENLPFRLICNGSKSESKSNDIPTFEVQWDLLESAATEQFRELLYKGYIRARFDRSLGDIIIVDAPMGTVNDWKGTLNNYYYCKKRNDDGPVYFCDQNGSDVDRNAFDRKVCFNDHGKCMAHIESLCAYYHPYGNTIGASFFNVIDKPPKKANESLRNIVAYELLEMASRLIVIADERVYRNTKGVKVEIAEQSIGTQPMLINVLRHNLKVSIIEVTDARVKEDAIYTDSNAGDILVIHQGLIEKMKEKKEEFFRKVKSQYRHIIIDSGRGVPEALEPGTRYIEIGAIEKSLRGLDKYSLVQTLLSVRRPRDGQR